MSIQHPQLLDIDGQLRGTARRAHALTERAGSERWQKRPVPGRWAPSECVQHLVATIDAFLPLLDAALDAAPVPLSRVTRSFRPALFGRILIWVIEPPYRVRTKTAARFVPPATRQPDVDLAELEARHALLRERMARADGYPLDHLSLVSPFDARVSYSLFTTFVIVPTHERRHLWQAERALDAIEAVR